jgi:hypothetical protein
VVENIFWNTVNSKQESSKVKNQRDLYSKLDEGREKNYCGEQKKIYSD